MPPKRPYEDEDFDDLEELEIYSEEDFEFDYDELGNPTKEHHDDLGYLDYIDEDEDFYDDYEDDLERNVPTKEEEDMGPEDELPFKPVAVDGGSND